jgi:hypothetical protein
VKIGDILACAQELIGGGEVRISLIKVGPFRCPMPTGMEHSGDCRHERSTEEINDMICDPCLILDVDMELLQVCGPLFMAIILQLPLCLYELQRIVISVDDCLLSQNVIFPLTTEFHNGIDLLVIGGVFPDGI